MMNGDMDPQTPLSTALPAKNYHDKPNQIFVEVPWSPHGVLFASHTDTSIENMLTGGLDYLTDTCGFELFSAFVNDPTAPLDLSCLQNTHPLEFSETSSLSQYAAGFLFGTSSIWGSDSDSASFQTGRDASAYPVIRQPFVSQMNRRSQDILKMLPNDE
jgi:hypothetical protein